MATQPSKHIIKAFAVHEQQFYPMTSRREVEDNALLYLGGMEEGEHASTELAQWHTSALKLLNENTDGTNDGAHAVLPGTTDNNNGGRLIGEPWYAVFEYGPGDLWAGRFFDNPAGLDLTEQKGVFVIDDTLGPVETEDNMVILNARLADRSVILAGRSAGGDSTFSSNLGGENNVRNEW